VLDPFVGAGTTIGVAEALGRRANGCELYQKNAALLPRRTEIVRAEVAEYLRERAQGDKAAAIESASKGQYDLFAPKGAA
jgi:DNA modification methylase